MFLLVITLHLNHWFKYGGLYITLLMLKGPWVRNIWMKVALSLMYMKVYLKCAQRDEKIRYIVRHDIT